ncbi:hypothetical protein ColLi_03958 [Colletotrichum liriopes]|uniref:Uncharacterized protein n=1 Tax=Colletotrichum liriopes TaxID=708192 RepID=A0AA37GI92_9PEZI|nr:hypothetical protein ColLi_03958 [Colletotrichum liriopes]
MSAQKTGVMVDVEGFPASQQLVLFHFTCGCRAISDAVVGYFAKVQDMDGVGHLIRSSTI